MHIGCHHSLCWRGRIMRTKCEQQIEIFRGRNLPCDLILYMICTRYLLNTRSPQPLIQNVAPQGPAMTMSTRDIISALIS